MTDELTKLAERCEAAAGPDRELDGAIALHAFKALKIAWGDNDRDATVIWDRAASPLQFYTASLDAAMTLVPEGWSVTLHAHSDDQSRASAYWGAHAYDFSHAATPALALCAAALKSRASQ